jgi:hypothetical protein
MFGDAGFNEIRYNDAGDVPIFAFPPLMSLAWERDEGSEPAVVGQSPYDSHTAYDTHRIYDNPTISVSEWERENRVTSP